MSRYNLLDEKWITVMIDEKGNTKDVSLLDLFENAHFYYRLAGDTPTQNFAVLRVLLAVLHTVFSRFDANGEKYSSINLDNQYRQVEEVDDDDLDDYVEDLYQTWEDIWNAGKFPDIVTKYLEMWREHFFLFDDRYPFSQVLAEDVSPEKINKAKASTIQGKNINRLISESGNKMALFSPKASMRNNKDRLTDAEIARWLITFQGYSGLSDKVIFGENKYDVPNSKGWLYDLGGIAVTASNLFQTLWLNCVLVHPEGNFVAYFQKPAWEFSGKEVIQRLLRSSVVDNLSELYTNWSRAIYIDPDFDPKNPFSFDIVKLPEINHKDQFIEPMTVWRYNGNGPNKDSFTPKKHPPHQAAWRSFGLITLSYARSDAKDKKDPMHRPGIMTWLTEIRDLLGDFDFSIEAISMQDDGNATSWVPVDETHDELRLHDLVVTDVKAGGWVPRINEIVELTKDVVGKIYRSFLRDIQSIRDIESSDFANQEVELLYYLIDQPFREWLADILPEDSKDNKVLQWKRILKKLVLGQANTILQRAGRRDYLGTIADGKVKNIATSYRRFSASINKILSWEV